LLWNNNASAKKTTSSDKGQITEHYAEQYLTEQGLTLIERNFHSRQGEIDLIMLEGNTYVFIEVKYRKSSQFGGAIAAIPASKQKKIKYSVTFYLHQAGLNEYNTACRIDVIALEGDITQPQVTWLKNAF
jgi:putative endonuclease